jgi:hypothetical protein
MCGDCINKVAIFSLLFLKYNTYLTSAALILVTFMYAGSQKGKKIRLRFERGQKNNTLRKYKIDMIMEF